MSVIHYYYTSISPYAYLGHDRIRDVARLYGATLAIKPMNLGDVFAESGALPLAKRPPIRQRYRLFELQRMAEWRGKPLNLSPKFFPADPSLADLAAIALLEAGKDPTSFMSGVFSAVWVRDENIADEAVIAARLSEAGFDPDAVIAAARAEPAAARRAANTAEAIEAGIVGAPGFVLNGEPFWGQDRIEFIERALSSGREPFRV